MALLEVLLGVAIAALVAGIIALVIVLERKRRHRMAAEAARLGLRYHPRGLPGLAEQFSSLEPMNQGQRRRTRDVMEGPYRGLDVRVFDFLYDTVHHDSKGRTRRQTHHVGVALAVVPATWPRLTIQPEHIGHKLWDAMGGDDIDFESDEFSRKFWVKSDDRKFAYDVLHPRAMELLLAARWRKWQLWGTVICSWHDGRLRPADVAPALDRLADFLTLMPTFRRPTGPHAPVPSTAAVPTPTVPA